MVLWGAKSLLNSIFKSLAVRVFFRRKNVSRTNDFIQIKLLIELRFRTYSQTLVPWVQFCTNVTVLTVGSSKKMLRGDYLKIIFIIPRYRNFMPFYRYGNGALAIN